MAVRITGKRMSGGTAHRHITDLQWQNESTGKTGQSTRAEMVRFVDDHAPGSAYTRDNGPQRTNVHSVHPTHGSPYVQTYRDGRPSNNLLALPDF